MTKPGDRKKRLSWEEVSTTSSAAEAKRLLDLNIESAMPGLLRNEAHHCRSARTDVADSNPARRFFEGGQT